MISAGAYRFFPNKYDMETHITAENGRLWLDGLPLRERPTDFPCFMIYKNHKWIIDNVEGKKAVLDALYKKMELLQKQTEMIEEVEVNG